MLRGEHPDVVEIDPSTNQIVKDDADRFVREVHASPIEGERKVVMLLGADRLNDVAANRLLKTIEEPPARSHLVLVSDNAERLLLTIRSRCQRVDFSYLAEADVREAVRRSTSGASATPARVDLVARLAGGRVDRARDLAGRLGQVRDAFLAAAESLDGTGAAAERGAQRISEAVAASLADLEVRQDADVAALDAELAAAGYPTRVAQARRRLLTERHEARAPERAERGLDRGDHRDGDAVPRRARGRRRAPAEPRPHATRGAPRRGDGRARRVSPRP